MWELGLKLAASAQSCCFLFCRVREFLRLGKCGSKHYYVVLLIVYLFIYANPLTLS